MLLRNDFVASHQVLKLVNPASVVDSCHPGEKTHFNFAKEGC